MSEALAVVKICPCGCGRPMPQPLLGIPLAGQIITGWLEEQGISVEMLRSGSRRAGLMQARRVVAHYLEEHEWSPTAIGDFLNRDHTTVYNLLQNSPSYSTQFSKSPNGHAR